MIVVRLETEAGGFVTYATVPPFKTLPIVLLWGSRFFVRHGTTFVLHGLRFVPRYREAFTVAIVDPDTPRAEFLPARPGAETEKIAADATAPQVEAETSGADRSAPARGSA